jgi:hypothetical protein
MNVSQARIDANRRNCLLSKGPTSPEGKRISRANALKHGLCASAVVPEDLQAVQLRSTELFDNLKPQDEVQAWMVDQAAVITLRIDRCVRMERRARDKSSLRAELTWDDDRRLEAETLGRSLHKDPGEVVEALRRTPHGCDWLMDRWAMLAYSADVQQKTWTDEQTRLAFDLLATPHALRPGKRPGLLLDRYGQVLDEGHDPAAVARREIAALEERRAVVAELDEVERHLAASDLSNEGGAELRRLRRYESTLHSRLRWCLAQIALDRPYRRLEPVLRKEWGETAEPELKPEPKSPDEVAAEGWTPSMINPPFDLTEDEAPAPGYDIDLPAILSARREKRFRKAEARREAKRQKADRLRG